MNFLVFLVIGIFMFLEFNAFKYIKEVKAGVEVRVFLSEDADVNYLKREIKKEKGVEKIAYLSEEYALQEFKKEFKIVGDEPPRYLESIVNLLPASFRVALNPDYKNPEYLNFFSAKASTLDGVEDVVYGKEYIQAISTVSKYFKWLSYIMCGLLFFLTLLTLTTSLNHRLLVLKNEITLLHSFGVPKWRLKIRVGVRAFLENIVLSGAAMLVIYCIYHFLYVSSDLSEVGVGGEGVPASFIVGFVGGCGVLTFIVSLVKKI